MGSPSISGSRPLAFYIATARDDVREQARFISRRGRHSYVRSGKTLLSLVARGHKELIARKRSLTHTFETPDRYRRFRPLPAPTFEHDLPNKAATTCWSVAPFKANARNRAISHSAG